MSDRPSAHIAPDGHGSVRVTVYRWDGVGSVYRFTLVQLSDLVGAASAFLASLPIDVQGRPLDAAAADAIVTEAYRTNPPEKGKPGAVFAWMRELHRKHPGVDVDEMIATYNRIRNTGARQ